MADETYKLDLLPQHKDLLIKSAITPEVAQQRRYWSIEKKTDLEKLGFGKNQRNVPALGIPILNVRGVHTSYQIRPDKPRMKDGKVIKYETPKGVRMTLDVPVAVQPQLDNPTVPLFITEGSRKVDSAVTQGLCCIGVLGVWNFRGTNQYGGKVMLADWDSIALNGRKVYIVFDSDIMEKEQVHEALERLKAFLESRDADVKIIYLPCGKGGTKIGLDDYFYEGHTVDELLSLATSILRRLPAERDDEISCPYCETDTGIYFKKKTEQGDVLLPLTNFTARIIRDISEDDGVDTIRCFELEAKVKERKQIINMPASQFQSMSWVCDLLGAEAVLFPFPNSKEFTRVAIQLLSRDIPRVQIYKHLGWREVDGKWFYLHANGAIGTEGLRTDIKVSLSGPMSRFALPEPLSGDALTKAVQAVLRFLMIAPDVITFPLFCSIWRGVLGGNDFSIHVHGPTGCGKTETASLVQQFWGSELDSRHLPASWTSTDNALEGLAFVAKDAILVVDDFAPSGTQNDVLHLQKKAERIFRAQGNRSGRGRMRADGKLRPDKPPRGVILSTGEEMPSGLSLRARVLTIELEKDALDWQRLTLCQNDASHGFYAQVLSSYICWLAERYGEVSVCLKNIIEEMRSFITVEGGHRRTPYIIANLSVGLKSFLEFCQESNALSADECTLLQERWQKAVHQIAENQIGYQRDSEPTLYFLEMLKAALVSGSAHVADIRGEEPTSSHVWGWMDDSYGLISKTIPKGERIGWIENDNLYLDPQSSYLAAQKMARNSGINLTIQPKTLHKRLNDEGLLLSTEVSRTLTVRRVLQDARRHVLHLRKDILMDIPADENEDISMGKITDEMLTGV